MKFFSVFCGGLLSLGVIASGVSAQEERDARWHDNISNANIRLEREETAYFQNFEEYLDILDEDFDADAAFANSSQREVSLQFEMNDAFLFSASTQERAPSVFSDGTGMIDAPWKWRLSHFNLHHKNSYGQVVSKLPEYADESDAARRFALPFQAEKSEPAYVATAGMTRKVADVSIYTEFGISGGEVEEVEGETLTVAEISEEDINQAINLDLAGYYVSGGANVGVGNWTVDVQAGYGSGAATSGVEKNSVPVTSSATGRSLIGGIQPSRPTIVQPQEQQNLALFTGKQDPFQLIYFRSTADANVTDKLGLKFGALCFAVPEILVSAFEGNNRSGYGFQVFGDVNYQLGKSLNYTLYLDYALSDEEFNDENIYQILNKVEFNF